LILLRVLEVGPFRAETKVREQVGTQHLVADIEELRYATGKESDFMKIRWPCIQAIMSLLLLGGYVFAQSTPKPLTNDDVIAMVEGGLAESTVINAIAAQDTHFDVSAAALLKLKQQGVSPKIMDAMLSASTKPRDSAPAPAAGSPPALPADGAPATGQMSNAPAPTGTSGIPAAQPQGDISGVYSGEFRCTLTKFALKLSVSAGDAGSLTAVFDFSPLGPAVSQQQLVFDLRGSYEQNTQKFRLTPVKWEATPPQGYQMVGMSGTYDTAAQQLNGKFSNIFCGAFHLTRDRTQSTQSQTLPPRSQQASAQAAPRSQPAASQPVPTRSGGFLGALAQLEQRGNDAVQEAEGRAQARTPSSQQPQTQSTLAQTAQTPTGRRLPSVVTTPQAGRQTLNANAQIRANNDLWGAVSSNDGGACRAALDRGADINYRPYARATGTVLILAAWLGKLNVVKCLVEGGADVNALAASGSHPRVEMPAIFEAFATPTPNFDVVIYLAEHGANVNTQVYYKSGVGDEPDTPLMMAIEMPGPKRFDVVKSLVGHGADVNYRISSNAFHSNEHTPLTLAYQLATPDICEYLVSKGATVDRNAARTSKEQLSRPPVQPQDTHQQVHPQVTRNGTGGIAETTQAASANVAGTWEMSRFGKEVRIRQTLTIQQSGGSIKGTLKGRDYEVPIEGTVTGNNVQFYLKDNSGNPGLHFSGTVKGDSMGSGQGIRDWRAERVGRTVEKPAAPSLSPQQAELWAQLAQDTRLQQFTPVAQKILLDEGVMAESYCQRNDMLMNFYHCSCFSRAAYDARIKRGLNNGKSTPIDAANAGFELPFMNLIMELDISTCVSPANITKYGIDKTNAVFSRDQGFSADQLQKVSECVGSTLAKRFSTKPVLDMEYANVLFNDAVKACRQLR